MSEKNLWVIELETWPCSHTMSHSCLIRNRKQICIACIAINPSAFTGVYSSRSSSRKSAPTAFLIVLTKQPSSCWEYFFLQNDRSWRKFVMFACAVYSQLLLSAIFLGHAASLCITHLICTMVVLNEYCWMHQCFRQTGWKPPQVRKFLHQIFSRSVRPAMIQRGRKGRTYGARGTAWQSSRPSQNLHKFMSLSLDSWISATFGKCF